MMDTSFARSPVTTDKNAITSINLAALPRASRFDFWSEVICRHFSPSENRCIERPEFMADLQARSLSRIEISQVNATPMISTRDPASLRSNPLDHYFVSVLLEGNAVLEQNGRITHQAAGDLIVYDSARPFEYRMERSYSGYWLRIPRSLMDAYCTQAAAVTARSMPTADGLGRIAKSMLFNAMALDRDVFIASAPRLETALMELLSASFEQEVDRFAQSDQGKLNRLDRVKAYLMAHLGDPELNLQQIEKATGVSRRTLARLFAVENTTPMRWLWQQRVERSRQMLASDGRTSVTQIALACGFNDFSHFSRSFRTRFGTSPSAFRSAAAY